MTGQLNCSPTLRDAFLDASRRLARAGVGTPRLDARLLIAAALEGNGGGAEAVLTQPARPMSAAEELGLAQLVYRREGREPLAHILGKREFWSMDFRVTADVLTPRPDSETMVEAVLKKLPDQGAPLRLLDLGTGSGCLLLALLSELPQATGTGVDISASALDIAGTNARTLGLESRARFIQSDWCDGITGAFDVILANPPYIPDGDLDGLEPEVGSFEPRLALAGGADGLDAYRTLIPGMCGLLATGGAVFLEIGFGQAAAVSAILRQNGFQHVEIKEDLSGVPRVVEARTAALFG